MSTKTVQLIGATTIIAPAQDFDNNKEADALNRCSPYPTSEDEREDGRRSATDYRYKNSDELTSEERAELCTQIRDLIDYYFGDENYPHDKYLRRQSRKTDDGTIPLDLLVRYKKLKKLTKDISLVADAVRDSNFVELSADRLSLKRHAPLPTIEDAADKLQRTIGLVGEGHLGALAREEAEEMCGQVLQVRVIAPEDPIPRDLKQTYLLENGTLTGVSQMKREKSLILLEMKNRQMAQMVMEHLRKNSNLVFDNVASLYLMSNQQPQTKKQPNENNNNNLLSANAASQRSRSATRNKSDRGGGWRSRSADPRSRSADPRMSNRSCSPARFPSNPKQNCSSASRPRSTSPACFEKSSTSQPSAFRACGARSVSPRPTSDALRAPAPIRAPSPLIRLPTGPENPTAKGFGARRTGGWKPVASEE